MCRVFFSFDVQSDDGSKVTKGKFHCAGFATKENKIHLMVSKTCSTAKFNLFSISLPQIFGSKISIEQLCQFFLVIGAKLCGRILFTLSNLWNI